MSQTTPPTQNPIPPYQAARFLQQASFSSTESEIAEVQSLGYEAWLKQAFDQAISTSNWDWLTEQDYDTEELKGKAATIQAMMWRLITSPDVLRQRYALALSEFFVVGFNGVALPHRNFALAAWWDMLCAHAFGNYRDLLEAVTLSPAMGRYLNTAGNQKEDPIKGRQPDENYAREILQLFSIGLQQLNQDGSPILDDKGRPIETYTQDDISQLARVFTGWVLSLELGIENLDFARQPMRFVPARHSMLEARFLGVTIPANTDGIKALRIALDTVFKHPNVGPFFGKQMIQRLVTSNPSPAYVARVARAFDNNGQGVRGDMKAVILAILLDQEARNDNQAAAPDFGKLREPILCFLQWARSFHASAEEGKWNVGNWSNQGVSLGQQPLDAPSVFNFFRPAYVPPNTAIAKQELVAPEFQLVNEASVAGYINFMQRTIAHGQGDVHADYSAELEIAHDADALVQRLNLILCAEQMSKDTFSIIRNAISTIDPNTETGKNNRVHAAILMTMSSPDYLIQR
ncbi:MAG: hypothetical protein B7Y40_08945 [Gammaproteobacteria bacterium 28-57-27]|nr:MAG: hypothetical protein B7Y40_08945 [Gammaproteobacteria bacterium 28-57-27]